MNKSDAGVESQFPTGKSCQILHRTSRMTEIPDAAAMVVKGEGRS